MNIILKRVNHIKLRVNLARSVFTNDTIPYKSSIDTKSPLYQVFSFE
jgi:hypothetical protein